MDQFMCVNACIYGSSILSVTSVAQIELAVLFWVKMVEIHTFTLTDIDPGNIFKHLRQLNCILSPGQLHNKTQMGF